jgi:hypothetical protein
MNSGVGNGDGWRRGWPHSCGHGICDHSNSGVIGSGQGYVCFRCEARGLVMVRSFRKAPPDVSTGFIVLSVNSKLLYKSHFINYYDTLIYLGPIYVMT